MCYDFISNPNAIILAVSAANQVCNTEKLREIICSDIGVVGH